MPKRNVLPLMICALLVACSDDAVTPTMMSPVGTTAGTAAPATAGTAAPATGAAGAMTVGTAGATGAAVSTPLGAAGAIGAAGTQAMAGATAAAAGSGATGAAAGGAGAAGAAAPAAGTGAAGTASPAAGSGGMGAAGSEAPAAAKRPCVSKGNEVLFIGDSYSDYIVAHPPLADLVADRAKQAGALGMSDSYNNKAVAGTTLAAPPAAIPGQWSDNKSTKPKLVVMDGGGNDVLINNPQCRAEGSEKMADCMQVVQDSLDTAKMMLEDMKASGVSDVIFFWYPHIPGGALTGFQQATSIADYTYPMLEDIAKTESTDTFHVFMVPTVDIFEGHPEYFYSDGLHANATGEGKIADAVWKVMKDNCIAQAASSMCCVP